MRKPDMGTLSRKVCDALYCDATATHWTESAWDMAGSEWCQRHAEDQYRRDLARYQSEMMSEFPEQAELRSAPTTSPSRPGGESDRAD